MHLYDFLLQQNLSQLRDFDGLECDWTATVFVYKFEHALEAVHVACRYKRWVLERRSCEWINAKLQILILDC